MVPKEGDIEGGVCTHAFQGRGSGLATILRS